MPYQWRYLQNKLRTKLMINTRKTYSKSDWGYFGFFHSFNQTTRKKPHHEAKQLKMILWIVPPHSSLPINTYFCNRNALCVTQIHLSISLIIYLMKFVTKKVESFRWILRGIYSAIDVKGELKCRASTQKGKVFNYNLQNEIEKLSGYSFLFSNLFEIGQ